MASRRHNAPRTSTAGAGNPLVGTARRHLIAAAGAVRARPALAVVAALILTTGLGLSLIGRDAGEHPTATVQSLELPLPGPESQAGLASDETAEPIHTIGHAPANPVVAEAEIVAEVTAGPDWTLVEVRSGQTLERIFRDLDLSPRLLHQLVNHDEHTRRLTRIRPGDEFAFELDETLGFTTLRAEFDEEHWLFVDHDDSGLATRIEPRALDRRVVEANGVIASSLFNAAKAAGMSDNMTMRLANIFGWDIDFAMDIRAGDRFSLVYEEIWRDGEFLRDGPILAARFVNQGEAFEAVRFDAGNGYDYFSPDGRPMRKAFLRAPLNFTRVTSNFNPRRFHPITQQIRPHNGTDYGAPTGTPVWAAGDGRVIRSAYNNANGNYVFIQHGNNIVTRYLHLHQRQVRVGDRVRQGQTIGTVGMTGMATGPHLHYEFLVNGAHRNPRTVDLPDADPLPPELMDSFLARGRPLLAKLDQLDADSGVMLARRDVADCDGEDASC